MPSKTLKEIMLWCLHGHNCGIYIGKTEKKNHLNFPKKLALSKKFVAGTGIT